MWNYNHLLRVATVDAIFGLICGAVVPSCLAQTTVVWCGSSSVLLHRGTSEAARRGWRVKPGASGADTAHVMLCGAAIPEHTLGSTACGAAAWYHLWLRMGCRHCKKRTPRAAWI